MWSGGVINVVEVIASESALWNLKFHEQKPWWHPFPLFFAIMFSSYNVDDMKNSTYFLPLRTPKMDRAWHTVLVV